MKIQDWQDEIQTQTQYGRLKLGEDQALNQSVQRRPFALNRLNRNFGDAGAKRYSGHLSFLKSLQGSGVQLRLVTIFNETVMGIIKGCDETTISLRIHCPTAEQPDAYQSRVFFKQSLVEFSPVFEGVPFS